MTGMGTSISAVRSSSDRASTYRAPSRTGCASASRSITSRTPDSTTGIPGSTLSPSCRRSDSRWLGSGAGPRRCASAPERTSSALRKGYSPLADRLDVVAVGVEDEGGVVVRPVVVADSRGSVVPSPRVQRRLVKCVDAGAVGGGERQVQRRLVRPPLRYPERRRVLGRESRTPLGLVDHLVAERREGPLEEPPAPRPLLDFERNVVVHRVSSFRIRYAESVVEHQGGPGLGEYCARS